MTSSLRFRSRGAALMVCVIVVAFLILPAVGFLSFEIGRANLCQQQLQNALDAASLTAVATLTINDDADPVVAHQNAIAAAVKVFQRNSILAMDLTGGNTTVQSTPSTNPQLGQAHLFFQFRDPLTRAALPISDPRAQLCEVSGSVGTNAAFGKYLGIDKYIVRSFSNGTVPDLDLVLCFDCSGSIDDQTNVTLVKRVWVPVVNKIQYSEPAGNNGRPSHGRISDIVRPDPNGTSFNGAPPQWLEQINSNSAANPSFVFQPGLRSGFDTTQYQSTEQGRPPGNSGKGAPGSPPIPDPPSNFTFTPVPADASSFTDSVVNIDGNTVFGGTTVNYKGVTYSFPNVASLVEAARGNLDTNSAFQSSRAFTSCQGISPKTGYQAAYLDAAYKNSQPLQAARDASLLFAQILNNDTIAHFGFVAFNEDVGTELSSLVSGYNDIDSGNDAFFNNSATGQEPPYGNDPGRPVPQSIIDATAGNTRFTEICNAIAGGGVVSTPGPVATGGTNIGAAVDAAVTQLVSHHRPNAVKAIVLFTDGQATEPGPADVARASARAAAVRARDAGIPVYTIGLAQNQAIIQPQFDILNDSNSAPATGGIAAISGQGAIFSQVTSQADLRKCFERIARTLVRLVQR